MYKNQGRYKHSIDTDTFYCDIRIAFKSVSMIIIQQLHEEKLKAEKSVVYTFMYQNI